MRIVAISKISLLFFSLYISGCVVGGCNLMKAHEFKLTFIGSKSNPLPNVGVTCSGKETGNSIAIKYNEQKLISNTNGEIVFHRQKAGSYFSYRSVGFFSWGYTNLETKVMCVFSKRQGNIQI